MKKKSSKNSLVIKNLHVSVEGEEILKGVTLTLNIGEIHVIMGPNGSGKSTLCYALMGHPGYKITRGSVELDGKDILALPPNKRAELGLFLGFQYPREIPGLKMSSYLRTVVNGLEKARNPKAEMISPIHFKPVLEQKLAGLKMSKEFANRNLNEGFSGGEKKRSEILQMQMLKPSFAILDEIDSGLDIDGLRYVAEGINKAHEEFGMGVLLVTHYKRILDYVEADAIHVMMDGKIVKSGDSTLVNELEKDGFENILSVNAK